MAWLTIAVDQECSLLKQEKVINAVLHDRAEAMQAQLLMTEHQLRVEKQRGDYYKTLFSERLTAELQAPPSALRREM